MSKGGKKDKNEPITPLVKRPSYTRGWLADYNALRKPETFAEGVFLKSSAAAGGGRVIFSLSELPSGQVWLTENETPLERLSNTEIKIGDHVVPSPYAVEWQRTDPLDLEIRPVRRRIERIAEQLSTDMSDSLDLSITANFVHVKQTDIDAARRRLERIFAEMTREFNEILSAIDRIDRGTDAAHTPAAQATTAAAAARAVEALDRANAAIKLRAELGEARRKLREVYHAYDVRLRDFLRRQVVIEKPSLAPDAVAAEVDRRLELPQHSFGRNDLLFGHQTTTTAATATTSAAQKQPSPRLSSKHSASSSATAAADSKSSHHHHHSSSNGSDKKEKPHKHSGKHRGHDKDADDDVDDKPAPRASTGSKPTYLAPPKPQGHAPRPPAALTAANGGKSDDSDDASESVSQSGRRRRRRRTPESGAANNDDEDGSESVSTSGRRKHRSRGTSSSTAAAAAAAKEDDDDDDADEASVSQSGRRRRRRTKEKEKPAEEDDDDEASVSQSGRRRRRTKEKSAAAEEEDDDDASVSKSGRRKKSSSSSKQRNSSTTS
jgi:hypothetical protein